MMVYGLRYGVMSLMTALQFTLMLSILPDQRSPSEITNVLVEHGWSLLLQFDIAHCIYREGDSPKHT